MHARNLVVIGVFAWVGCGEQSTPSGTGACASGDWWSGEEGPTMSPGGDCISCHASGEGPDFTVAGTVMNDFPDGTGCTGVEGVEVRLTDADGALHTLTTNASGNFYTSEAIPTPYTVELAYLGSTRAMGAAQTDGDCVSCHTATGENAAPGRIIAP